MTMEEYVKIARSANEQPNDSEEIGRYEDPALGWMTLYRCHDGEIRYVTDRMRAFDEEMKEAAKRRKREKRRRDVERFSNVHTNNL